MSGHLSGKFLLYFFLYSTSIWVDQTPLDRFPTSSEKKLHEIDTQTYISSKQIKQIADKINNLPRIMSTRGSMASLDSWIAALSGSKCPIGIDMTLKKKKRNLDNVFKNRGFFGKIFLPVIIGTISMTADI